jgi:uncharacterized protein YegL
MNQGTGKKRGSTPDKDVRGQASSPLLNWGVKFYALTISVFVHVVALSVFAAVKLTQTPATTLQTTAVVSINQARQLAQVPTAAPKPKVVAPHYRENQIISKLDSPLRGLRRLRGNDNKLLYSQPSTQVSQPAIVQNQEVIKPQTEQTANVEQAAAEVEFFDNTARGRRICYVVDCSGSMQGLWGRVKAELVESIEQLQQDQYFCVIVYGAGSILEINSGKMTRATEKAKAESYNFINSLKPAGSTNAMAAIQQAVKIRDQRGDPPSVIYFLTDGFELSEQDGSRFANQVATMLRSFSPKTQINTIGLWPDETDKRTLETIARESGGKFTLIGPPTTTLEGRQTGENQ